MGNKRFIFTYFTISGCLMLVFGICMFIIDPFYHYHKPIEPMKLIPELQKQVYQNVGMARNIQYDAILTGSSMTENFRVSQLNLLFDCSTIKLSFPRGRMHHYDILFEQALKNEEVNIKKVFYGCDISAYIESPTAQIPNEIPKYLYDENIFTDVKYLLNKTIMFETALPKLKMCLENNVPDIDYSYMWYMFYTFSKTSTMAEYQRSRLEEKKATNIYEANVKYNCEIIGKYIRENPDVEFNIFFPPYSILYYDEFNQKGELEAVLTAQEKVTEYFIQFENVKLSSFLADKDIICNLDNYKDYTHYSEKINEYMAEKIKTGEKLLNKENYKEYFESVRQLLYNYNYNQLFE